MHRVNDLLSLGMIMEVQQTEESGPIVLIKCKDPALSVHVPELSRMALFLCGFIDSPFEMTPPPGSDGALDKDEMQTD